MNHNELRHVIDHCCRFRFPHVMRAILMKCPCIIFLLSLLLSGCVPDMGWHYDHLVVYQSSKGEIYFDLSKKLTCKRLYVGEIRVINITNLNNHRQPSDAETFWHIVPQDLPAFVIMPIQYGEKIANFRELTPTKSLVPGSYELSGGWQTNPDTDRGDQCRAYNDGFDANFVIDDDLHLKSQD